MSIDSVDLTATSNGLHVVCDHRAVGPGIAFLAQRSSPPLASHWVLHLSTSETAGELTRVVPTPVAQCLDADGALALVFHASVNLVHIEVKGSPKRQDVWRFWLEGGAAR
jgi:hypothetical protein